MVKRLKIAKSKALMVGDNPSWDYWPARGVGIDALLIFPEFRKDDIRFKKIKRKIRNLSEVLEFI